jgi:hypothetical protein
MGNAYNLSNKEIEQMREALMKSRLEKKKCTDCGDEFEAPPYVKECSVCFLSTMFEEKEGGLYNFK